MPGASALSQAHDANGTEVIAQMDNAGDPFAPWHAHADEHEPPVQAEERHQKNFTDHFQIVTRDRPGGSPKEFR